MSHFSSISDFVTYQGLNPKTTLCAGLRDARMATNRHLEQGSLLPGKPHGSLLGLLGYFAVLDQIGGCYKKLDMRSEGNSIEAALTQFSPLSQPARQVLYALRCAVAHDYALHNPGRPGYAHHFRLTDEPSAPLICMPTYSWNGEWETATAENVTTVNVVRVGDLVESVYRQLVTLSAESKVGLVREGGLDRLEKQYVMNVTSR